MQRAQRSAAQVGCLVGGTLRDGARTELGRMEREQRRQIYASGILQHNQQEAQIWMKGMEREARK